ncbi:MAG: MMPL family transporter [Deltaproteobacteria bacterium]|nr:MMPL family transporter [Deltaproteobacteria bacterium]
MLTLPLRAPRLTLAVIAALTVGLGLCAARVRIDPSIDNLLPTHDADRAYYETVKTVFGSEEASVIGVFGEVFTPATLASIDRLSTQLAALHGVREVLSLTTVKGVESDELGLRIGKLVRRLPRTDAEAAALRAKLLADPLYVGNLVSADGQATSILVLFEPLSDREFIGRDLEGQIRRLVDAEPDPSRFAITGMQTLKVNGARLMEEDLARFVPLSLALVILVLVLEFRSVRGVLLPLAAIVVGTLWTTGVMGLAGSDINLGTLILPPLLMAIGVAYAIHVVSRYYDELRSGGSREQVVARTMRHEWLPVTVAWLTTVVSCATLAFNPILGIRDFGVYSVVGITAIFAVSLFLIPAALLLLPHRPPPPQAAPRLGRVARAVDAVGRWAVGHRAAVLIGALGLCAVSLWGAARITVETDYLSFFSPDSIFRRDNTRIADALGGTQPIYITIDGDGPGALARLDALTAMRDLQRFLAEQPGVTGSLSLADYVALLQGALAPDRGRALPDHQDDVDQLMVFVDPADVAPVAAPDFSRANIIVRTRLSGSAAIGELAQRIDTYAASRFRRGLTPHVTGSMVLLNRSADDLARGQVSSLWQVLVMLFVIMSAIFVSLRAGLLSLVPNVIPIIALFGLMGWAGIPLNISTSMIAVIAIGIAVDDTIHYFSEFNVQLRATGNQEQAILNVVRTVGSPIVYSALALTAGFAIVCLSNFQPIRHFGILASSTMAIGLVAELLITPALVMTTTIITIWDVLFVKLGPEPQKQIPLFAGLRPFQAKIVVSMARLAAAVPGEHITRRGEMKAELYVLLNGRADVRGGPNEPVIRRMGRGEVIGEMGLVRQRPRSADVVVAEPTEYLVLDQGFLDRLQRRHPRTAATVFLNLTRILSDRLENTTDQLMRASH